MPSSTVAGVVVLARHGDRQGFYQNPNTYTASHTSLTVLGYVQELYNGQDLRALYLTNGSPSAIRGVDFNVANIYQLNVMGDAGGEGGVIVESANAIVQGLYPPFDQTMTLANGTTVSWAGRAQLVPIETIEPDQSVILEGWTQCTAWTNRLNAWYDSADFKDQAKVANAFYDSIADILGNRSRKLENGYNIFDYLNVEGIHNATLSKQITPQILNQAAGWSTYHEAGSFSDPDPSNIGNVAGQAALNPLLSSIHSVADSSNPLKFQIIAASYKPFVSLFQMLRMPDQVGNTVDYASTLVFEIYDDSTMTLLFRNGSQGAFTTPAFLGTSAGGRISTNDFEAQMRPYSIDSLAEWCDACQQTTDRGCRELYAINGTGSGQQYASINSTSGTHAVSPLVAGVIGAVVALAVASMLLLGIVFFRRNRQGKASVAAVDSKAGPSSVEPTRTTSNVESDGSSETDRKS